jgi:hypothetical protein
MTAYLSEYMQSPLMDFFEQQKLLYPETDFNIGFALQQNNNLTDIFYLDLKYRLKTPNKKEQRPQRNIVIELFSTAKSGTGKSTVAISIAWYIMKLNNFNLTPKEFIDNYVHFTIADFKDKVKIYNKIGSCHVFDETRKSESLGIGSTAFMSKVGDIVSVCRIKGLSVIRIMPNETRNKTINPHLRIDVNKISYENNSNLSLLQDDDLNYRGHIITVRINNPELWSWYEKKKLRFVESTLADERDERFGIYERMAEKLFNNKDFPDCKKKVDKLWLAMKVFGSEMPKSALNLIIARADVLYKMSVADEEEKTV